MRHYQPAFATGGLFFPTREVLPVGEPVLVEVRFPQLVNKTILRGQVAWCRGGKHRTKIRAGLGIEFQSTEIKRRDFLVSVAKGLGQQAVPRRYRRLPVLLQGRWRLPHERDYHAAQVEDIGTGGAFVRTDRPAPEGQELVLEVIPPGSVRPLEIAGRVAWVGSGMVEGSSGFGMEFRCRDAGGVRRLKELVRRLEEMEEQAALDATTAGEEGPVLQEE